MADSTRSRNGLGGLEEQYRLLMECVTDYAIFFLGADGRVSGWNAGAQRLLGYPAEQALGQPFSFLFLPDDRERGQPEEELRRAAAEGQVASEGWRLRRDGGRFWAHGVLTALRSPDGGLRGYAKILRDLTERHTAEEQLRDRDRAKDAFLAVLGHELRNPLAPLKTAAHLLRMRGDDPATVDAVRGLLDRQVDHLARLVDDLLDASRIGRGKLRLEARTVDLAEVVRSTVGDQRPAFDAAGLTLDLRLPAGPVWVRGDATRLSQVVRNLVGNAVKFTDTGGRVAVRLEADRALGRAVLTVEDTGAGIAPDVLPRLFEPFTQGEETLSRSRGGLGLGLAVVKGVAALHGGGVEAASAGPGRGATFRFWLPLAPGAGAAAGPPPPSGAAPRRALRVLVVEDNRDAADSLRMLLESLGHEARVAYTGPLGVEEARRWRPEVVLCDLGLPGLDGFAVCRALREDPATAGAHCVLMTGHGSESILARGREVGFEVTLTKPVAIDRLEHVLAEVPGATGAAAEGG